MTTAITLRTLALTLLATLATLALAQGSPSGEYGAVAIGQPVSGTIAGIQGEESFVYHTYVLTVPQGAQQLTIAVDGGGADLDLAVKAGAPIIDYDDVDHLDITEDPNPVYVVANPAAGVIYIDILNLLPNAASYRLTVTAGGGAPAAATPATPTAPTAPTTTQGSPSGEYGTVAIGGSISGVLAAIPNADSLVYHTYVVTVPAGTPSLTIQVQSNGADLDLAVKIGTPIVDYGDVDYLDVSEESNPSYVIQNPSEGVIYVDVLNLLPSVAAYTLSVFGGAAGDNPQGANPFTPATPTDPFMGSFEGDGLSVIVQGGSGSYQGELILGGQRYPFAASGAGEVLQGNFSSGGQQFPFTAVLQGDTLRVESGGNVYTTVRIGAAPAPAPAQPANPLGGASVPNPNDPVVAQGSHGVLTQDNALAFIEALEFSLQQVGYTYVFTDADRQQLLQALIQNYPQGQPSDQAILAQARQVWTQVQANWPASDEASRREFIVGVFILAFGEEAVQQAMGGGGGGNSAAGCADIDSCMATYADPETYNDSVNAQSCWAAAGCTEYDPSSNDFYYEVPDYDSYD